MPGFLEDVPHGESARRDDSLELLQTPVTTIRPTFFNQVDFEEGTVLPSRPPPRDVTVTSISDGLRRHAAGNVVHIDRGFKEVSTLLAGHSVVGQPSPNDKSPNV